MKKIISVLLAAVMLLGSLSVVAMADDRDFVVDVSYDLGDVNDDGATNALDALALRSYIADSNDAISTDAADVLLDRNINAKDLLVLRRCLANIDSIANYESATTVASASIAGNDLTQYELVIPNGTERETNIHYAARQMQKYVEVVCGYELPIVEAGIAGQYRIEFMDITDDALMQEKLEIENFIYEVADGDLRIYGTRRGNMYAVFEILEEYFGIKFYHNFKTYLDEKRSVDIAEGTYEYFEPALNFRFTGAFYGGDGVETHYFPRKMNGTQIYRKDGVEYGTLTGPHFINAHSYGYYWRMATGWYETTLQDDEGNDILDENGDPIIIIPDKEHASIYYNKYSNGFQQNELQWNPCFTNDMQYATLFRGMLETMRMIQTWSHVFRKETSSMSFSICDNNNLCTCMGCSTIADEGEDFFGNQKGGAGGAGLNLYLANRAAVDIREYYVGRPASDPMDGGVGGDAIFDEYPDMKIYTIFYDHSKPTTVLPEDNVIIMFCGVACQNHLIGSDECKGQYNNLAMDGYYESESLKMWGDVCKDQGAELWFWVYPVNYNMKLFDTPNLFNFYYDYVYMVTECNVTGIYYEGSGTAYLTEELKSHATSMLMDSFRYDEEGNLTYMSYDEYCDVIKEFTRINYGDGYEEIFRYYLLWSEVGDAAPCFINNFDRPGDMYGYEACGEKYEEMRALLVAAKEKTTDPYHLYRINCLLASCDFMGLSANYKEWCEGGTNKEVYMQRYERMHTFLKEVNYVIFTSDVYTLPETLEYDTNPMVEFYEAGSWRATNADTWGYMPSKYGWGFQGNVGGG